MVIPHFWDKGFGRTAAAFITAMTMPSSDMALPILTNALPARVVTQTG
jgi:hypothetical protein